MPRVLVVDDQSCRHEAIEALHPGAQVAHAYDYVDATYLLRGEPYDVAYLDHDLGFPRRGHPPTNGEHVASYVAALPEERRPRAVVVHSNGVDGPRRMVEALRRAGIPTRVRPFFELVEEIAR